MDVSVFDGTRHEVRIAVVRDVRKAESAGVESQFVNRISGDGSRGSGDRAGSVESQQVDSFRCVIVVADPGNERQHIVDSSYKQRVVIGERVGRRLAGILDGPLSCGRHVGAEEFALLKEIG